MALPKDVAPRSQEEWMKLAATTDPMERKVLMGTLRAIGHDPVDIMSWSPDKRVAMIMEAQGEAPKGGGKGKASPAADTSTKAAAPSGGGGGIDAATVKRIAGIEENLGELDIRAKKIHDLLVVLCLSIPEARANAEDMEVELKLLGNG